MKEKKNPEVGIHTSFFFFVALTTLFFFGDAPMINEEANGHREMDDRNKATATRAQNTKHSFNMSSSLSFLLLRAHICT